jgi:hypothetical protein
MASAPTSCQDTAASAKVEVVDYRDMAVFVRDVVADLVQGQDLIRRLRVRRPTKRDWRPG